MPNREHFAVLTVDDDPRIRRTLRGVLEDEGHETGEAANASEAYDALERRRYDAVLLDLTMPGEHGLDALLKIREQAPDTAVIVVSGESTLENAVRAGQRGAFDFVPKPINDPEHLLEVLREAVKVTRLRRGAKPASNGGARTRPGGAGGAEGSDVAEGSNALANIVGDCAAMERMREQIRRVAPSNGRVLITGENGAGKELAAFAIHALSKRSGGAFVKLNCAAIPKDLLESELFGYEKGAFTGAVASKKGRLELADGGTRTAKVDVRLLAATNKDLAAAVKSGDFREDLYFRLNVLPVAVPPLRERKADIGPLASHFLARFAEAEGRAPMKLTDDARELLEEYHWPGNVREMRNLMERAVVLVKDDEVTAADLNPWLESPPEEGEDAGLKGKVARSEIDSIRRALDAADWNVTQAAAGLGIDRTNLHLSLIHI